MRGIPDPVGAGVVSVLAASEALHYPRRYLLGSREPAEVLDAADAALDADDWDNDCWWLDKPAGGSS